MLKFMFSKKATKIDEIFTINWHYVVKVKSKVKILSTSVAFLTIWTLTANIFESGPIPTPWKGIPKGIWFPANLGLVLIQLTTWDD